MFECVREVKVVLACINFLYLHVGVTVRPSQKVRLPTLRVSRLLYSRSSYRT